MSITQKDIKLLWGRSGSRCAICRIELSHEAVNSNNSYVIGEQAHIVGELPTAPRGNSPLLLDERNTYHNLVLLCPTHHTEIDKNESDWPIERLYQTKSTHELWVRESLSSVSDLNARANELIVSSIIDSVVTLLRLESWSEWTSFALSPDTSWPDGLGEDIYSCVQKLMGAIWPPEFDELKRSAITLARLAHKASETFLKHAVKQEKSWFAIRFYSEGGWNPNYDADLLRFTQWQQECFQLIHEATKAANWFSDIVRRDINPLFFAEKGKFLIEEGPFLDGTFRSYVLQFTDEQKASLPDAIFENSCPAEPADGNRS